MRIPIARWLLALTGIQNGSSEVITELANRLKRYDMATNKYRMDFPSLPKAVQMVMKLFPHKYCRDRLLREGILRAFVTTVIPGADEHEENLVAMYADEYYPFHTFCDYFAFDLNRRSKKLFNGRAFIVLSGIERTQIVQHALDGGELTRRLYEGAILMAQVSYFGAIYNEERGCPLIDFPGQNSGYRREEYAYPFAGNLFGKELSFDGHPW